MQSKRINLFERQKSALDLIFYSSPSHTPDDWRILITDTPGAMIIQNYYTIKDLRENMFTLQLSIREKRERMYGVTAVYFVEPSKDNLNMMVDDAKNQLYIKIEIHFLSFPEKDIIAELARQLTVQSPEFVKGIKKLDYVNMYFHPIDPNIVLLPSENQISSFLSNLEYPPVFVFHPDEQELVSKTIEKLDSTATKANKSSQYCSVVIFVSRKMDYKPVFQFGRKLSQIMIDVSDIKGLNKLRLQNLDITLDSKNKFWIDNKLKQDREASQHYEREIQRVVLQSKEKMSKANQLIQNNQKIKLDELSSTSNINKFNSILEILKVMIQESNKRYHGQLYQINIEGINIDQVAKIFKENGVKDEDKLRIIISYMLLHKNRDKLPELEELIKDIKKPPFYDEVKNMKVTDDEQKKLGMLQAVLDAGKNLIRPKQLDDGFHSLVLNVFKGVQKMKASGLKIVREENFKRIKTVILYVHGGISFIEYEKLMENMRSSDIQFIYAGDKIAKADDFLKTK